MPKQFITLVFLRNSLDENQVALFILTKAYILGHRWKNNMKGRGWDTQLLDFSMELPVRATCH